MLNLGFIYHVVQNLASYFFSGYHYQKQTLWFKKALYIYVIFKCIYWLCYFSFFFGPHSIVYFNRVSLSPLKNITFLLYNSQSPALNAGFIGALILICLFCFFYRKSYFLPEFFAWFITLNIHNTIYPALSGGDYLLNQFLFLNCFLSLSFSIKDTPAGNLKVLLHNLGALAILIQVCLAYSLSALAKLNTAEWLHAEALTTISRVKHFSLYQFPAFFKEAGWLSVFLNYLLLFYQFFFPILVWISKIRKPFLLLGICMHLYIAFVIGLPWFAFIMIIGYIFFWPFQRSPEFR